MKKNDPTKENKQLFLTKVAKKIADVKVVEDDFPGVIIIHNVKDLTVVHMSKWGQDFLGVTLYELQEMGTEYHTRFFNPEDSKDYVPKIIDLLERNNPGEIVSFFQQVRRSPQHDWSWFLGCMKVFLSDEAGIPLLTLTTVIPVDVTHNITTKVQRLLEENNFLRHNHHLFDTLTKREKEILGMMARGHSSGAMAKKMNISEETVQTHRRNINRKLNPKNNYDIIRFAQAFDLI
jgi:DNA-binding CsgD family transcriptional regulator